jgi:hypothetical protein
MLSFMLLRMCLPCQPQRPCRPGTKTLYMEMSSGEDYRLAVLYGYWDLSVELVWDLLRE